MEEQIKFITIDGRGEHDAFKDCITQAIKDLKPGEGIHVIKDFEPFPMYKMMESKGFDYRVEKVSDKEFHVYFTPHQKIKSIPMSNHLNIDAAKIQKIIEVKVNYLNGNWSYEEARRELTVHYEQVSAQEFAICEQYLQDYGISDDLLAERMEDLLGIFEGVLESKAPKLPDGHPIQTYMNEINALRELLDQMENQLKKRFIHNEWAIHYERLSQIHLHFSRKQNQLFPALEKKGFDKPSKVMWTLDNQIRDAIKEGQIKLTQQDENAFLILQKPLLKLIEDMMVKESEILFPTALELLTEEDFAAMRLGDDEIGYCLIENPGPYVGNPNGLLTVKTEDNETKIGSDYKTRDFMTDLAKLLEKHGHAGPSQNSEELQVSQGKLSLEQINLIFKHLQVDLSYVDEHDIVKFYSDTKHRVFPRSPGVIGREVRNCHPRESVATVEEIIRAFKAGEQEEAEFWLEIGDKFIYIIYTAVRDEHGQFRGILEMMQDVTKIRGLSGSQRLLSWDKNYIENEERVNRETDSKTNLTVIESKVNLSSSSYEITPDTLLGPIVKKYPFIKDYLISLSPKFSKLSNPMLFKTMSSMATFQMISDRGGLKVEELIEKIIKVIDEKNN